MKTLLLWLACFVSLIGSLWCFFSLLMVGSFEASGHYSKERFQYNESLWSFGTLLFLLAAAVFGFLLVRNHKKRNKDTKD
jgi:amino acid transporter